MDPKQPLEWLAEFQGVWWACWTLPSDLCFWRKLLCRYFAWDGQQGKALRYLLELLKWQEANTIVAGDSGNDQSMFDEVFEEFS